jgi:DNA-binding transcriptional ArsR family regulator
MVNYHERLDRTFAALGDPTRRAILARLEREDGTSVSEERGARQAGASFSQVTERRSP